MQALAVRREVAVDAPPERAFAVFTDGIGQWWPGDYSIGAEELDRVVVEPTRWLEVGKQGTETVWGDVLAYEPGRRLLLEWRIGGGWGAGRPPGGERGGGGARGGEGAG